MDPPPKHQPQVDTDATRSLVLHNLEKFAAASLFTPLTTSTAAKWHPAKAFSACNHTCEHNFQCSNRPKQLRKCPLWPKIRRWSVLRHSKNARLHPHCTEDCPASPRREGPVLRRSVNQAEWTTWAEVLFDEMHDILDRHLGRNHPDINFNRLGDWMVPIPDDGGGDGATAELLDLEGNGSKGEDGMRTAKKRGGIDGKEEGKRIKEWFEHSSLDVSEDAAEGDAMRKPKEEKANNGGSGGATARLFGDEGGAGEDNGWKGGRGRKRVSPSGGSEEDRRGRKRRARTDSSYGRENGKRRGRKRKQSRVYYADDSEDENEEDWRKKRRTRGKARQRADYDSDDDDSDEGERRERRKGEARKRIGSGRCEDRDERRKERPRLHNAQPPFSQIRDQPSALPLVPPRIAATPPPLLALARAFIGPSSIFSYLFAPARHL